MSQELSVLRAMRARIQRYGFSAELYGGPPGCGCFIHHAGRAREALGVDMEHMRILRNVRPEIAAATGTPFSDGFIGAEFATDYLRRHNIDTQKAVEIMDAAIAQVQARDAIASIMAQPAALPSPQSPTAEVAGRTNESTPAE